MSATSRSGKKKDILRSNELRHAASWLVEEYDSEEEEFYPGTDIPLEVVSQAAGANDILEPRRSVRGKAKDSSFPLDRENEEDHSDFEAEDVPLDDAETDEDALEDDILALAHSSDED